MVDDNEHWEWVELSSAVGEALLDVERTFLDVVERQAGMLEVPPVAAASGPALKAYLEAWSRLDVAHRGLARFLTAQGKPLQLKQARCGQCSQELR